MSREGHELRGLRKPVALTSRCRKAAHCDGNVRGPKQRLARQDRRRRLTHQHPTLTSFLNSRGLGAVALVAALSISASVVDSSPFSTNGALVVANALTVGSPRCTGA